ncbi:MAG TPA: alkaline phosphatase family protein [Gammaproteobacteria bacterium]|nr:alkaline phosphatase family protein [Gammaproteobacteria bacterium]
MRKKPVSGQLRIVLSSIVVAALLLSGCNQTNSTPQTGDTPIPSPADTVPRPSHVVIVVEENKAFSQIIDNPDAAYLNQLADQGALFDDAHGVTHPSQPNYLALFSGSTQAVTDDSCPHSFSALNLASELRQAGYTFATYSQSLPEAGYTGCGSGAYARKHNPAVNWQSANVQPDQNLPFDAFPDLFDALPTVSLVIPDLSHDMHDGSVETADRWLEQNLSRYVQWAYTHNSLLIVTWDEDDNSHDNHIPTIFVGPMVKAGRYSFRIDHYAVLRTIEAMYGLPALGESAKAAVIADVWKP